VQKVAGFNHFFRPISDVMGALLASEEPVSDLNPVALKTALKYGLPTSTAEYTTAINDALRHDWTIEEKQGWAVLSAPPSFMCNTYSAVSIEVEYGGALLHVPDYVLNEEVRRTGDRAEERAYRLYTASTVGTVIKTVDK
jgi:hypothetical protein